MLEVLPLGRGATIIPKVPGTLYLRINDNWSELADNMGKVTVEIQADGAE
jgi:hypothetical protein